MAVRSGPERHPLTGDNFFDAAGRTPTGISVPTCQNCHAELVADDLVRHDHDGLLLVHCPNCGFTMGTYNRHSDLPRTDKRQGD